MNEFEKLCVTRREEIINNLLKSDTTYQKLTHKRAITSQAVMDALNNQGMLILFEAYSDAIYAQEVYELEAVYKEAFHDASKIPIIK